MTEKTISYSFSQMQPSQFSFAWKLTIPICVLLNTVPSTETSIYICVYLIFIYFLSPVTVYPAYKSLQLLLLILNITYFLIFLLPIFSPPFFCFVVVFIFQQEIKFPDIVWLRLLYICCLYSSTLSLSKSQWVLFVCACIFMFLTAEIPYFLRSKLHQSWCFNSTRRKFCSPWLLPIRRVLLFSLLSCLHPFPPLLKILSSLKL